MLTNRALMLVRDTLIVFTSVFMVATESRISVIQAFQLVKVWLNSKLFRSVPSTPQYTASTTRAYAPGEALTGMLYGIRYNPVVTCCTKQVKSANNAPL